MLQSVFKDILNSMLTVFPWSPLSFDQYGKIQTIQNQNHTSTGPGSILHPGCIQTMPPAGWTKPHSAPVSEWNQTNPSRADPGWGTSGKGSRGRFYRLINCGALQRLLQELCRSLQLRFLWARDLFLLLPYWKLQLQCPHPTQTELRALGPAKRFKENLERNLGCFQAWSLDRPNSDLENKQLG